MVQHNAGNPVRQARERAGLSQIQLSLKAKRSLSTLRNAEQGLATKATLAALARALGVPIDVLTGKKPALLAAPEAAP